LRAARKIPDLIDVTTIEALQRLGGWKKHRGFTMHFRSTRKIPDLTDLTTKEALKQLA
jgi:hypothetical protein